MKNVKDNSLTSIGKEWIITPEYLFCEGCFFLFQASR
jgi:hypothetical protein